MQPSATRPRSRHGTWPTLVLVALALVVGACAGANGAGPTLTGTGATLGAPPSAVPSTTPGMGATVGPSPSAVPSTAPRPTTPVGSDRHADPGLEALLPVSLGGVTLVRESQRGIDLSQRSAALEAFLAGLGRSLEDFTLASAYDPGGGLEAQVGAWRIAGADPALLMPGFTTAVQASSTTPLTITDQDLAGRHVTRIGGEGELTQGPLYGYVRDDVILFVQTPDEGLAAEAIGKLPEPSAAAPAAS